MTRPMRNAIRRPSVAVALDDSLPRRCRFPDFYADGVEIGKVSRRARFADDA